MKFKVLEYAKKKNPFENASPIVNKTLEADNVYKAQEIASFTRNEKTTRIVIFHNNSMCAIWSASGKTVDNNNNIIGDYTNEWIYTLNVNDKDIFDGFVDF